MKTTFYLKLISITLFVSVAAFLVLTPGRASADAPLGCGLLAPVNRADSDPKCLDENNAQGDGQYFTCTIADTYGSDNCESAGSSQATLKSNFIGDLQYDANDGQPYQKISAAWIEAELGGANWAARIDSSSVTLQLTSYSFSENSEYVPTSNTSGYVYYPYAESDTATAVVIRVNGVFYDAIKVDCGNLVGSARALPPPNNPPTGSFVSLVCNAAAETYTIKVNFDDPDGATTAELRGTGGAVYETSGGTSATWTISTKTLQPGSFPVELWVKDVGPSADNEYKEVATHAIANCVPQGSISSAKCYQVTFSLWDPNNPDNAIKYYLAVNGTKFGPYSFGGQASGSVTESVATMYTGNGAAGFNYWGQNQVTLYGVDNQTGAQQDIGSTTLTTVCGSVACGTTTLPATMVAGEPIQFQDSMTTSSVAPTPPPDGPPGASFTSIKFDTLSTTSPYTFSGGDLYSSKISYTPQVAGYYPATWTFGGGESNPSSVSCFGSSPEVAYEPYFTEVGGDVSAGEGFGASCTDDKTAGIAGEDLDAGAAPYNYFGASSRQAAIASGAISQFATDTTNNIATNLGSSTDGVTADSPSNLAFGNTAQSGTTFGGSYLGSSTANWCVPDYVSNVIGTTATSLPNLGSLAENENGYVYRLTGDQTIGAFQLNPGVHVTVIVSGNVYLTGNITYGSYTSLQDIPQFTLMTTGGNIYIDPGVSELHGFYNAQPTATTNGYIFTCATGVGVEAKSYGTCDTNPLTIYGAVAAGQIIPGRTLGNVATTTAIPDDPAEQFVFTPELWLGSTAGPNTSCSVDPAQASCTYQSYTSLPPVL